MSGLNLTHRAISTLCACWFALCVFLTSGSFCNAENDIKFYTALAGGLVLTACTFLSANPRRFVRHLYSIRTMRLLFIVGALLAVHGLLQWFGILPSRHAFFRITGSFENPAGISAVLAMLMPVGMEWLNRSGRRTRVFALILLMLYAAATSSTTTSP